MKTKIYLLSILIFVLYGCSKPADMPLNELYPDPWREDFDMGISKTFIKNNINGCGQYKYRESIKDKGVYLVYCTNDGTNWNGYIVRPNIGEVKIATDMSLK